MRQRNIRFYAINCGRLAFAFFLCLVASIANAQSDSNSARFVAPRFNGLNSNAPDVQAETSDDASTLANEETATEDENVLTNVELSEDETVSAAKVDVTRGEQSNGVQREPYDVYKENGVYFCVSDTGIGISAKDRDKIFDNFYRAERSRSHGSGDGIGLAMVKSFVEVHGGRISVESKINEGSSFSFTIPFGLSTENIAPIIEDDGTQDREDATTQISAPNPAIAHSILIIDDDVETTDLLERCLESSYKILKTHDGETGLTLVAQSLPDLIICDLDMPGTGGHEFITRLRQDRKYNQVKVLVLTGSNSEEDLLKSLEEGADTYLLKPVSLKELKLRLEKLLKEKEAGKLDDPSGTAVSPGILKEDQLFLMRCQEIIDQHLSEDDFSVKTMAAQLAMSHSSLYKKIKAITGLSLIGFVNDYKLHRAVLLFRQGESNVTSVCEKCGFKDEKNFRELFRRKTGLTPKQYVLSLNTKNTL